MQEQTNYTPSNLVIKWKTRYVDEYKVTISRKNRKIDENHAGPYIPNLASILKTAFPTCAIWIPEENIY
jgi:hypothetical protein